MIIRILYETQEITENFPCDFCKSGVVDVKKALHQFKDMTSVKRIPDLEQWHDKNRELIEKIKQGKISQYNYYIETKELNYQFDKVKDISSSINEEIPCSCKHCEKVYYIRFFADAQIKSTETITNDDLIQLQPCDEKTLKKIAARTRLFTRRFEDFQAWISGEQLKKAAQVISTTVAELLPLNDEEVNRLKDALKGVSTSLENKLMDRKLMLLRMVQEQVRQDRPYEPR